MELWKHFIEWCRNPSMIKIRRFNPGITMAALFRGTIAGAVSGVIHGAVTPLIINIVIHRPFMHGGHLARSLAYVMRDYFVVVPMSTVFGVIFGVIFGLIFVALYDRLPGKTPAIKGIMTSLIYWIAIPLCLTLRAYLHEWGFEGLYLLFDPDGFEIWGLIAIELPLSIIWGWLLGRFWESEWLGRL